jgi:hypothetical protein
MSAKPRKSQDPPPHPPPNISPADTPVVHLDEGEENRTRSLYDLPPIEDGEVPKGDE